jgi:hypothetical protein
MPHYFYDTVLAGDAVRDEAGLDLEDHQEVRRLADEAVSSMVAKSRPTEAEARFSCVVRDEAGLTVYSAGITFTGRWGPL